MCVFVAEVCLLNMEVCTRVGKEMGEEEKRNGRTSRFVAKWRVGYMADFKATP